jgi:hypothetical protein
LLAVTDNFWLVVAAVCGGFITVVGTVVGTWLLSWLQERTRYRHAVRMVATELMDNVAEVARYERDTVAMEALRERLSIESFDTTRFELARLQRGDPETWALLVDRYRKLRTTIRTGEKPPSATELESLSEGLLAHWFVPLRRRLKYRKLVTPD